MIQFRISRCNGASVLDGQIMIRVYLVLSILAMALIGCDRSSHSPLRPSEARINGVREKMKNVPRRGLLHLTERIQTGMTVAQVADLMDEQPISSCLEAVGNGIAQWRFLVLDDLGAPLKKMVLWTDFHEGKLHKWALMLDPSIRITEEMLSAAIEHVKPGATLDQVSEVFGGDPFNTEMVNSRNYKAYWRFYFIDATEPSLPYEMYQCVFRRGKLRSGFLIPNG